MSMTLEERGRLRALEKRVKMLEGLLRETLEKGEICTCPPDAGKIDDDCLKARVCEVLEEDER